MNQKPRYRLAVDGPLHAGAQLVLKDNVAHYISNVLRLKPGDALALFSRSDGEWRAEIRDSRKRDVVVEVKEKSRAATRPVPLTVCFAPIKGGRLETIIEKATELGAAVLQPVITQRSIVDKLNRERAESIAREAAEQCERTDWPEIREPVKLDRLLGDWPNDRPLIYGDESGEGIPITEFLNPSPYRGEVGRGPTFGSDGAYYGPSPTLPLQGREFCWGILVGPEGGFAPEEFAALRHVKAAIGVGLGPRILRADTAVITLCAATLMAWGDWSQKPRFTGE